MEDANAANGFTTGNPSYNHTWRNHPNLRYGNSNQQQAPPGFNNFQGGNQNRQGYQGNNANQQYHQQAGPSNQRGVDNDQTLQDILKSLTQGQAQLQTRMQQFETQLSQIATTVSNLEAQSSGKLPSQTIVNPKETVNAITICSEKQLEEKEVSVKSKEPEKLPSKSDKEVSITKPRQIPYYVTPPPFPSRLIVNKIEEKDKAIFDTFRRVQVNIPLLEAIKQIPRYAKFLKDFCTNKKRLKGDEKVSVGENVSAAFQRTIPEKCKDPGTFTIPCKIGNKFFDRALVDLGASINVIPYSVYASLNLGPLEETEIVIQLADRSNIHPKGVVEDVLVQVKGLVFPADFYVIDMHNDQSPNSTPIILGRPFLKTAHTKIDVHTGSLSMEFDGEKICFNIFEDKQKLSSDVLSVCEVKVTRGIIQSKVDIKEKLEVTANTSKTDDKKQGIRVDQCELDEKGKSNPSTVNSLNLTKRVLSDLVKKRTKIRQIWKVKRRSTRDGTAKEIGGIELIDSKFGT